MEHSLECPYIILATINTNACLQPLQSYPTQFWFPFFLNVFSISPEKIGFLEQNPICCIIKHFQQRDKWPSTAPAYNPAPFPSDRLLLTLEQLAPIPRAFGAGVLTPAVSEKGPDLFLEFPIEQARPRGLQLQLRSATEH